MTALLNWLYQFTEMIHLANYGLAIILLTILIKIALYPLSVKQMRSMVIMQQLAPRVKEIQERYRNKDPQKMQQKIMELYREHNVNPMAGCLPLLIQMPILIALYQALLHFNYADPAHARFLWVQNLSQVGDPYFILPLLAGLTTYVQSRMTTNMTDPTQRMMLIIMPIFIAWISATVPAGLALYWVTFNAVGIVQQYFVNRHTQGLKEALNTGGGSRENR
ncbi:MAG: YidC/Oxa1 family membrane protein insertase [Firmicutes bacterium]|nr:YidC/Oxa1 family membrane protein insertase [Bacillota bacterium]